MLNERGHEVLDTTPVALPVGWKPPMTLQDQIRMYIRRELSEVAAQQGSETFEDADDFDVGDDDEELHSDYQLDDESERLGRWNENDQRNSAVAEAERRIFSGGGGRVGVEAPAGNAPGVRGEGEGGVSQTDDGGARGGARSDVAGGSGRSEGASRSAGGAGAPARGRRAGER